MVAAHIDAAKGQSASISITWLDPNPQLQLKALCQGPFTLLLRLYHQIVRQPEAHNPPRRFVDAPVAGQPRGGGPGPPPPRPPTTRPTPPVATPPTSMPIPAPPAIKAVERLPLPFLLRAKSRVVSAYCVPFSVSEVNRSSSSDLPLKCPRRCATSTTPPTSAPFGTSTLLSPASTGSTTSPVKAFPARLVFTLMR